MWLLSGLDALHWWFLSDDVGYFFVPTMQPTQVFWCWWHCWLRPASIFADAIDDGCQYVDLLLWPPDFVLWHSGCVTHTPHLSDKQAGSHIIWLCYQVNNIVWDGCRSEGYKWDEIGLDGNLRTGLCLDYLGPWVLKKRLRRTSHRRL